MRRKLVAQRAGHIATLGEQQRVLDEESEKVLFHVQQEVINTLDLQISVIEKEMDKIMDGDPELKGLFSLLTGIKGIGAVTARFLIVYTVGFTAFWTWRKFASYLWHSPLS